ncbi:MAG: hypothetical protein HOI23_03405 [Deltaproteobacteria bacterium]|nr:hypothetical protein [Deltaproteobacteria bacterium]MBT6488725.1 hypothetical protein [Deltaproteobacteria bacterium]
MRTTYWLLIIGLAFMGCSSDSGDDANAPDTDPTSDDTENPSEPTTEVTWLTPPTGCNAPSPLPDDPLVIIPEASTNGGFGGGGNGGGGGGGNRRHMVNLEINQATQLAFTCGTPGLEVFDLSADTLEVLGDVQGKLEHLAIINNDYIVGTSKGRAGRNSSNVTGYGLYVFDVSSPENVEEVTYQEYADASGLAYAEPYLYMVSHDGKLRVFDMTSPSQPQLIGETGGLGNPWEVVLHGDRAYVGDNSLGVIAFDISTPQSPSILNIVSARGGVQDLVHANGHLFAAVGSAGVQVFTLDNPDLPVSLSTITLGGAVISVSVSGNHLWTTDQQSVAVTDISDPANPVQLAVEDTPSWAMHVAGQSEGAFVADWQKLARYTFDAGKIAPDADVSTSALYFVGTTDKGSATVTNRGGSDLIISGMQIPDTRFSISVDKLTLAPGETMQIKLDYANDGADLASTLCIASNDPDEPVQEVTLASSSSGSSVLIGETAPNFNLPDLDGNYLELARQLGKPVVLSYFATW